MRYAVIREGDHLAHAQHAGYYSPNNGSGNDYKRDRYLFQGVFRVENHGDAEIDLINSRDNSQARTKVPGRIIESGKTAIVNYLVRKSNSHAAIDAGQAKLAADAIERYVQQHFNTELHHSDDDDDVIETDDYLEHAQHEGYYSPNLTKNTTAIEQYPYKVGKCYLTRDGSRTDSYRTLMHVVLVNKNGKAGRMPDFIIALHRHKDAVSAVDSFLNTVRNSYPSYWRQAPDSVRHEIIKQAISLYYKYQDKPQHEGYYSPNLLGHSYIAITDDYLEHAQRGFYLGFDKDAVVEYTLYNIPDRSDANRGVIVDLAPKNRIDTITVNTSNVIWVTITPFDFGRARSIQSLKNIFLNEFNNGKIKRNLPNAFITDSEASRIAAKLWIIKTDTMGLNLKEKPKKTKESKSVAGQHPGYYSPNLRHSYEVIPAGDELYHFGTLGMKWGVRRYQNEDGTLTEEGKKRYTNKDGSYVDNESRQAIKKEISKRKGMAGASSVLGSALISSVILNPAVLAMPVAGLVLPAAIAATSAASFINNIKSMQLSQIKDRADMIDFHRSGNEPEEPIRVNVRRR